MSEGGYGGVSVSSHRHLRLGQALSAAFAGLPRAWKRAWGAILACAVVWSSAYLALGAVSLIWAPFGLAGSLVLIGALTRIAVSDDVTGAKRLGLGLAGLQFGLPELRLLGAALLCSVFMAMILSVVALLLLAVFGMAGLDAEAINQRNWAAVGPVWRLSLLAVVTVFAFYGVLVMVVRLSLFAPATLGRGHMVSLNSMGIAQGSFWPLLGGLLVVGLPKFVLLVLTGGGLLSGLLGWTVWAVVLSGLEAPLTMAFLGAAYRQLEYWTPQGATHD
ncbi:MAG: hypothetical protein KJ728_00085 [Alphaproteobacteria bacterium]|nr:hypothetical protein [Alphaproteobacteria bacterium]MBU1519804.1 hypothetical protein [Alphaproteobacteria bacterium]MBU2031330.1 hypothetical protein [Alphaproteobacteria bacterium]MBU2163358.1 hypothetical protein [Alphaproteobacteria bacterium]MBU2230656.1 hypothetical protein [Alphaproteobacteria bacterium]